LICQANNITSDQTMISQNMDNEEIILTNPRGSQTM